MANLRPVHDAPLEGEVIPARAADRYRLAVQQRMPQVQDHPIRRAGPLGLWQNQQDVGHARRDTGIVYGALEADVYEQGFVALTVRGTRRAVEAMQEIEDHVVGNTRPGSLAGAFAEDLAVDDAQRLRAMRQESTAAYSEVALNHHRKNQ